MDYCKRCVYPANARPAIIFDEEGVCSGCRYIESREHIDWQEREGWLNDLLNSYKGKNPSGYDCIIPVSGGKDSHFQTYLIKEVYGLNPLLVCYNHTFNTALGIANLRNLVSVFNCDLVRFTTNPATARKLSRYMLKKVGDITWHYHAGIMTFPIQTAVRYKIPLIVWGEEGFSELVGMHNQDDMVEFTKKKRQEHSMRGYEPDDILADPLAIEEGITKKDLLPFYYPSDKEIADVGVKGIYLSNYMNWNAKEQTELMIEKYGFKTAGAKERTFNLYDKTDDLHASGAHDYLKYLKFGYGRATDDASTEIRHGRMTREEGIEMVAKYDHVRPSDLDVFLKFAGMTEDEFYSCVSRIKEDQPDRVTNHRDDEGVEKVRVPFKGGGEFINNNPGYNLNKQKHYKIL